MAARDNISSAVYRIICRENGKYYFGSSSELQVRLYRHKNALRKGVHTNPIIQSVWNKYGEDSFDFEIVDSTSKDILQAEQKYLDEHVGKPKCMNIAKDAIAPMKGRKFSEESLEKLKTRPVWNKGMKMGPEYHSAETRKKISETMRRNNGSKR